MEFIYLRYSTYTSYEITCFKKIRIKQQIFRNSFINEYQILTLKGCN